MHVTRCPQGNLAKST